MVVSLSPSSYIVCVMSVLFTAVALVVGDSVCVSSESRIINQSQLSHKSCCISLNLSGWSLRSAVYEASACFSVDSGQRPSGAVIIPEEQSGICGIWSRLLLHVVSDHFDNWTQSELIVQWTQSHLYDKEIKDSLSSCGHFSFFFGGLSRGRTHVTGHWRSWTFSLDSLVSWIFWVSVSSLHVGWWVTKWSLHDIVCPAQSILQVYFRLCNVSQEDVFIIITMLPAVAVLASLCLSSSWLLSCKMGL